MFAWPSGWRSCGAAPGASGVVWRFLLIMLGLFVAQWIWFIVVPRQSLRLARGNPERQRRLLRLVINTPFPSGPKVFARFLLAASDQVAKRYASRPSRSFVRSSRRLKVVGAAGFESLVRQHLADTLDALGRRQEAEAQRTHARVIGTRTPRSPT